MLLYISSQFCVARIRKAIKASKFKIVNNINNILNIDGASCSLYSREKHDTKHTEIFYPEHEVGLCANDSKAF